MILPGILSLLLCCGTQGPAGGRVTVAAAGPEVPAQAVAAVEREVEPSLQALANAFPGAPKQPFRILLHGSRADLPPFLQAMHHEGSPGFALLARHEIHLLLHEISANGRGLRPVVVHELVHELLDQHCGQNGRYLPRWFHEGLAQHLAADTYLGASEDMIVWRAATQQLLPFGDLEADFPASRHFTSIAYAQSDSFVSWLAHEYGVKALLEMASAVDAETTLDRAMVRVTRKSTAALFDAWTDHVIHRSGAAWRTLLQQFFSISMVLALPLLAMALVRRLRVDRVARDRLIAAEREDALRAAALAAAGAAAAATGDGDPIGPPVEVEGPPSPNN